MQGKNWWPYTTLVHEVNKRFENFESITLKYFEPGHTFMSADAFHHMIEQGIRKERRIENFYDFVDVVEKKGKALVENIITVLCPHMEPVKRIFWLELPKQGDLPDLRIERDPCEAKNDEDPSDED